MDSQVYQHVFTTQNVDPLIRVAHAHRLEKGWPRWFLGGKEMHLKVVALFCFQEELHQG